MNYVSFSLWGDNPTYNVGAIRNAELMNIIYPEWKMILYYDSSVPYETILKLKKYDCILTKVDDFEYGCFWRFFASDLDDCELVIFRDADSRINLRERAAVYEWIESGKTLHVMRDHPYHGIPAGNNSLGILAGMWGIRGKQLPLTEMIKNFVVGKENRYGIDQTFLKFVYSMFENDKITHDDFFEKKPFPTKRENFRFVGERINANEEPYNDDWKRINNFL
jgi:hypothetical protein